MNTFVKSLLVFAIRFTGWTSLLAQNPSSPLDRLAPFIDDQTFLLARVDLTRLDLDAAASVVVEALPLSTAEKVAFRVGAKLKQIALQEQQIQELIVVYGANDYPTWPVVLIPQIKGLDTKKRVDILGLWPMGLEVTHRSMEPFLAIGVKNALDRFQDRKAQGRTDLQDALDAIADSPVQIVLAPGQPTRKILEEVAPTLPKSMGGGPTRLLTQDLKWISLGIDPAPQMSIRLIVQGKDKSSIQKLSRVYESLLQMIGDQPTADMQLPLRKVYSRLINRLEELLTPKIENDRFIVTLNTGTALPELLRLASDLPANMAERLKSTENMKQLGQALLSYHETYGHFPTNLVGKDGKPLLSWRVQLLPYLQEEKLYKSFKFDEPWDSDHNKKLLAKMPKIFFSPKQDPNLKDRTTYLAPLGKGLMWDNPKGKKISEVADGVTNTILLVETNDQQATPWTKPEDFTVDPQNPIPGLLGHYIEGFFATFVDGSVRMLPRRTERLHALFTCAGGEVIPLIK